MDEYLQKLENLNDNSSSNKLLLKSFKSILLKENKGAFIISIIVAILISVPVSFDTDTVEIYRNLIPQVLNVLIAFFGIVFTAFALLQAFINPKILKSMGPSSYKNPINKFDKNAKFAIHKTNESFVHVLMLSLAIIVVLVCLIAFLLLIPETFLIIDNLYISNVVCTILSIVLFSITFYTFISVKSVIRDLYVLFNLCIYSSMIDLEKDK